MYNRYSVVKTARILLCKGKDAMRQRYEIISHLKKKDWKAQWHEKVVEYTRENKRKYVANNCYFGEFTSEDEFYVFYHGEFQNALMATYFKGRVEQTADGCKLPGLFLRGKQR